MRWWDISKGKLVRAKDPVRQNQWGVCRIVERTTNGVLLIEEINHQSSRRISQGAIVRHYINASKLELVSINGE